MLSVKVPIEELVVGLFVDLHGDGKGFLINDEAHLARIKGTGLSTVDVIPEKSQAPVPGAEDPEDTKARPHPKAPVEQKPWGEKEHAGFAKSVKRHARTLANMPDIMDKVSNKSPGAADAALEMVSELAGVITGVDFAVNLMPMTREIGRLPLKHHQHSLNVSIVSMMLSRNLGLREDLALLAGKAGLFHDAGKDLFRKATGQVIGPDHHMYSKHPVIGMELAVKSLGMDKEIGDIILHHHESHDGSGFPEGLAGKDIPIPARILAVVDAFDNLCNDWSGQPAVTPHEALKHLYRERNKYGEGLLAKMIRFLGIYPPGSIVTLSDSLTAMVIAVNPENPLLPTIQIYDPKSSRKQAPVLRMGNLEGSLSIKENLSNDRIPPEIRDYFRPMPVLSYFAGSVLC